VAIAVPLAFGRLCQRELDFGGAVEIELPGENESRCFVPEPLDGEGEIVAGRYQAVGAPRGSFTSAERFGPQRVVNLRRR
jgi:hypothetical protein